VDTTVNSRAGQPADATGADPAGGLTIGLQLEGDRVGRVTVASRRPTGAARVFVGKDAERVPDLARRLFAVCGNAQGVAAVTALEAARGQLPGPETLAGRTAVVEAELAREHLTRVLAGWAGALGTAVASERAVWARALPGRVEAAAFPRGAMLAPGGAPGGRGGWRDVVGELETALEALLGIPATAFLALDGPEALDAYIADRAQAALAPAFLAHLQTAGLAGLGDALLQPLPALAPEPLDASLAGEGGDAFAARPEWEGRAPETGPLVRMADKPPVAAARAEAGTGLLARSVARLAELVAVPRALRELAEAGAEGAPRGASVTAGTGLGLVAAARGQLVHRVGLEGGTVTDYRILAPTEWNFHPRGCLVRALEGARFADAQAAQTGAGYLIAGIDPCVDYTLELTHA
jgi:hypothetical protein